MTEKVRRIAATSLRRITVLLASILALLLVGSGTAAAHVIVDSADPAANGVTVVTFSFNHSCADSPTTALSTEMPAGSIALAATPPPGWIATVGADTISWQGPGIATGEVVTLSISARLGGQPGEAILFPTTQTCEDGNGYYWADPDESGSEPAPRLIATAAILDPALTVDNRIVAHTTGILAVSIALAAFAAISAGAARLMRRDRQG